MDSPEELSVAAMCLSDSGGDDLEGMVELLGEDAFGELLPSVDAVHASALPPAGQGVKRERSLDDGMPEEQKPAPALAGATPVADVHAVVAPEAMEPEAVVDRDEQALLAELARLTGSTSTKDALAKALELLNRREGCPSERREPVTPLAAIAAETPAADESARRPHSASIEPKNGIEYARLMDSHGFGWMVMDMSGNFVQWNTTMQNVLGYSPPQMERLSMMHLTPAEDLPGLMEMMPKMMVPATQPTQANPMQMTKRCVTRSGQDISVDVRMSVISVGGQPFISCLADFHGPHTWELPVSEQPIDIKSEDLEDLPCLMLGAEEYCERRISSRRACDDQEDKRKRVPLPRDAVQELRSMLSVSRFPEPEVREEFSVRRGIDRKRVDRWLENARARESARRRAEQRAREAGEEACAQRSVA